MLLRVYSGVDGNNRNIPFDLKLSENEDGSYSLIVNNENEAELKGLKNFSKVLLGTSALPLLLAQSRRKSAIIWNNSLNLIYLGKDDTVTTDTGFPLSAGSYLVDFDSIDAWYGISATGSSNDIRILEVV